MKILVTGGAGYIGSHTCLELLNSNHDVVVIDNLHNGHKEALERVKKLSSRDLAFFEADLRDEASLTSIFNDFRPEAVIHFAGLKAVGESVENPLLYYECNVYGALQLLKAMDHAGCSKIVFSSSATVYGEPEYLPLDEAHTAAPINPYGRSKLIIEDILRDWVVTKSLKCAVILRYFNPVGAHFSGQIGEHPKGIPNNLMPYVAQVAGGIRTHLNVLGDDYNTKDGTGLRDYIHVVDLARAHIAAVEKINSLEPFEIMNIGSGQGATVLELVAAFEKAARCKVNYKIAPRRAGDMAQCWADPQKAYHKLNWKVTKTLNDMCEDTWRWQKNNLNGYDF